MTEETLDPPRQRVRVTYEKGEVVKFISNNDESRLWERTLRRADLPLLYKQGFNPQPHMQFAAALGVGITGVRELIDITFSPPVPLDELAARIRAKCRRARLLARRERGAAGRPSRSRPTPSADYTILICRAGTRDPCGAAGEERIAVFWPRTSSSGNGSAGTSTRTTCGRWSSS
ncbi:MAG: TIGR03936 family radical SAM-associated protein [Caldilineaceae bacterium]